MINKPLTISKNHGIFKRIGYTDIDCLVCTIEIGRWTLSVLTPENQVDRLIHIIHSMVLQLIYGLGVYSWGFDTIIQNDPEVRDQPFGFMWLAS